MNAIVDAAVRDAFFAGHAAGEEGICGSPTDVVQAWEERKEDLLPELDDPATTIFGTLLFRQMERSRTQYGTPEWERLRTLIQAFEAEFPTECQVWLDRYPPAASK